MKKYTKSSVRKSKKEFKKKHCQFTQVRVLYYMGIYFTLKYNVKEKIKSVAFIYK